MVLDVNDPASVKQFIAECSQRSGVYQMVSLTGEVLYIGKANNLSKRLASYFNKGHHGPKTAALVKQIHSVNTTVTNTESEALILECNLIKEFKPKYNILLRDDKSYPFICLSKHLYPRIYLFRGKKPKEAICFGPCPNVNAAKETIKLLQQVFLIRSCTDSFFKNRARPCLLHQINRCSAPCVDKINPADYSENIKNSKIFLEGKSQELISKFADLMETASNNQSYEQAAILRDRIKKLQTVAAQQYVSSNKKQHKSTDVIACIISSNTLIMAILQFRHGSLLGSKEYTDKISLEYNNNVVLEEIYLSVLSQFYLNLPESTGCPVELVLNFDLSHDNQQLLNNIINNNFRNLHNLDIITNPRGSKLRWLNLAEQNAKELFEKNRKKAAIYEHQFLLLKQELNLSKIPNRIECFDVSHTFGQHVIASCIVFNSSGPDKASYRRYNINLNKNSDTGSISEVLIRRYKKMLSAGSENMETMPEFILIDGGKGQVNAAKKVIADLTETPELTNIKIYGITKGEGRRAEYDRILSGESMEYLQISFKSEAMHLLQQIRNEAHRFAIVGHRAKRSKEQTHSLLEDLPGVGARRRRNLLMHLGGWQEVLSATVEQLAMVPGISKAKAKIIYEYLHDPNSSSKYIK